MRLCRFNSLLGSLLLITLAMPSYARVDKSIYQGRVQVNSQSQAERDKALVPAFAKVLIKVSGNPAINQLPGMSITAKQVSALVQSYSYMDASSSDEPAAAKILQFNFAPKGVEQFLQQHQQPVWSANRPALIAWIAINNNGQQTILSSDDSSPALSALTTDGFERGLSITVPMVDLNDLSALSFNDIWQTNVTNLTAASQRYQSQGIISAQINKVGDEVAATWSLTMQGETLSWQVTGKSIAGVIANGIAQIANTLASRFAILNNGDTNSSVYLNVSRIHSLQDYAKVLKLLNQLAPVASVSIVNVQASNVTYQLQLNASEQALVQALAINSILSPGDNQDMKNNLLTYRFAG